MAARMITEEYASIPEELKRHKNWVAWKHETRDGKKTKVPYCALTHAMASSTNPATWSSYDDAAAALRTSRGYTGIGFVFSDDVPYAGIDLDHCDVDGKPETWAEDIVSYVGSYTEKSFSGDGLHIIVRGKLPQGHSCKKKKLPPDFATERGEFEVYSRNRFFVMTGQHVEGTPQQVMERQAELEQVHAWIFGETDSPNEAPRQATGGQTDDDAGLLEAIRRSRQGYKFCKLFDRGNLSDYGDDDSAGDLALCNILAFWCGNDAARIERLFGESALGKRDKWISRQDYRERTIAAAIKATADKKHSHHAPGNSTARDWPDVIPFSNLNLPDFPADALSAGISEVKRFVSESAKAYQVPVDMTGMLVLAAAAAACAKNFSVEMRAGWIEPTNLYMIIVLEPGNRKSAIFALTTTPIYTFEQRLREDFAPQVLQSQSELRRLKKRQEYLEKQLAQAKKQDRAMQDELDAVTRKIAEFKEVAEPTLIVDDVTSEAIVTAMYQNGGKVALLSAEGDLFDQIAGRYTKNLNLNVYLKGHAGDTIKVNRIGRTGEYIPNPALTVAICSQREVLRNMNRTQAFKGRGLVGRFLYVIPESTLGSRNIDPPPLPEELRATYNMLITRLYGLARLDGDPHVLRPSSEALRHFDSFQQEIEERLHPDSGDLAYMSDWAGKLCGQVGRIAGVLHVLERQEGAYDSDISVATMRAAIAVGEYLIPHAKAAFSEMQVDPCVRTARRIVRWILRTEDNSFSRRDLFRNMEGGTVARVDDLEEPLQLLEKHGYIRQRTAETSGRPGRPKGPEYEVNPAVREIE